MIKDKKSYSILVIEDNPGDLMLVEDLLIDQIATPGIVHANNFKQAHAILSAADVSFDVILLDLTLPDKSGEQLVTEIIQLCEKCPVIILTGYTDIDFSIRAITLGIMDYLLKEDLNAATLYKSIVYAIERKKNIAALKSSEKRYSDLFHLSPQPMCLYDSATFMLTDTNKAALDHYGYPFEKLIQMTLFDLVPEEDRAAVTAVVKNQERKLNETYTGKFRNIKSSGEIIEVETFSTPLIIDGKAVTLVIAIDVTEKNLYEHKITKAIIKAQDDERYEIGGELHDNVCQILAAGMLSLAMLKKSLPAADVKWFNNCSENIMLASDEIRNLSHRLAPAFFDDSTLEEAFGILLNEFNVGAKYKIAVSFGATVKENTISLELQLNLYRILQEQLKNISKYANASLIEVDVFIYNGRLKMRIYDNGVGFNNETVKKGIGLANMKRRAELFSGKFQIDSSPGNGCTIVVDIPFAL